MSIVRSSKFLFGGPINNWKGKSIKYTFGVEKSSVLLNSIVYFSSTSRPKYDGEKRPSSRFSIQNNGVEGRKSTMWLTGTQFRFSASREKGPITFFNQASHLSSTSTPNDNKNSSTTPPPPPPDNEHQTFLSRLSIARPVENIILRSRLTRDLDMARFLAKAVSLSVYSVLGVTILGTFGVDTSPIIAGIGVTGFTLGFALKEIATNFLSGVLLVFIKPFHKGQHLKVMGAAAGQNLEGEVESIDARYVLLRTKDRGLLMIPSVVVYTNPILVSSNGIDNTNGGNTTSKTSTK